MLMKKRGIRHMAAYVLCLLLMMGLLTILYAGTVFSRYRQAAAEASVQALHGCHRK